jgi:hypothetical protein
VTEASRESAGAVWYPWPGGPGDLAKRLYDKAVRGAAAIIERPVWPVIPDVRTKLAVTAHLAEGDFAERLERALARSQKTRLIEHRIEDD